MLSEFLSPEELRDFTQRARVDAQAKVLEADGIPYRRRGRFIIVSRHHVRASLEGRAVAADAREPNMDAIR